VKLLYPEGLHERAWEMANRFHRPQAYDGHYLALAEMLGCELWMADERLYNAVKDELPWVKNNRHTCNQPSHLLLFRPGWFIDGDETNHID
jgi:hypothetical protein